MVRDACVIVQRMSTASAERYYQVIDATEEAWLTLATRSGALVVTAWTVLQDSEERAALLQHDLASTKSKKRSREEEEDELIIASQRVQARCQRAVILVRCPRSMWFNAIVLRLLITQWMGKSCYSPQEHETAHGSIKPAQPITSSALFDESIWKS